LGRWWNAEESVALSKILKDKGVDLIDVSSGALVSKKISCRTQLPSSDQIKSQAGMTGAVGLITEAKQAEEIVATGKADMVLFAGSHCVTLI
jgi:2,4-dienoyl-CoA reductase-like NADH-dependent reductase (Old Yellow Enzyme family)